MAPKSKKPKKQKLLIKGRCADIYATSEEDRLLLEFKDDIVSFDGKRKTRMQNKRKQACIFTSRLFDYLKKYNVPNYFVENSGENAIFINNIDLIPIQIVIRNEVSRNLSKTLGIKEGTALPQPVLEYYYDNEKLQYPQINQYHIYTLKLVNKDELDRINELAVKVNAVIKPFLSRRGLDLIDCTIQVGRIDDRFLLSSPITVENCSLRDIQSGTTFSQENLKLDSRSLRELYQTVVEKVGG